jgi:DNA-binding response OmpR family regulator
MLATEQKLQPALRVPEKISILVVSPHRDDDAALRKILQHGDWKITRAADQQEASKYLIHNATSVVICERDLPDGCWRDILVKTQGLKNAPALVVMSRQADEKLWGEVLTSGGYDVLLKPFESREVTRVVGMAWRQSRSNWNRPPVAAMPASLYATNMN